MATYVVSVSGTVDVVADSQELAVKIAEAFLRGDCEFASLKCERSNARPKGDKSPIEFSDLTREGQKAVRPSLPKATKAEKAPAAKGAKGNKPAVKAKAKAKKAKA